MKTKLLLLLFCLSMAAAIQSQNVSGNIIYSRATAPTGVVWLNDGAGTDSVYLTNAQIPKVVLDGDYILHMSNTSSTSFAFGGSWNRYDTNTHIDTAIYNNNDNVVGYDMLDVDSTTVLSYSCNLYHDGFNAEYLATIGTGNCYDDGPDLRQQDSLIVFHNAFLPLNTVHLNGGGFATIPNTAAGDYWPAWSPDGEWILFTRTNNNATGDIHWGVNIYKIRPNGEDLTMLTTSPVDTLDGVFTSNAEWSPDGQAIITAGNANGTYGLLAIKSDGSGITEHINTMPGDTINFIGSGTNHVFGVGVDNIAATKWLSVFPNPAEDHLSVVVDGIQNHASYTIVNAMGSVVMNANLFRVRTDISIDHLPAGCYHVIVRNGDKVATSMVVKR